MNKADLISRVTMTHGGLKRDDVDRAISGILEKITEELEAGGRVEIRGFGSFTVKHQPPRNNRNPKTGAPVLTPAKRKVHFKPGKELRERVNNL